VDGKGVGRGSPHEPRPASGPAERIRGRRLGQKSAQLEEKSYKPRGDANQPPAKPNPPQFDAEGEPPQAY